MLAGHSIAFAMLAVSLHSISAAPSCSEPKGMVLESESVHRLGVVELGAPRVDRLKLTGLVFHSSLAVERVDTCREGDALVVFVHLALAGGKSGQLRDIIDVPIDVTRVLFGKKRHEVWHREVNRRPE